MKEQAAHDAIELGVTERHAGAEALVQPKTHSCAPPLVRGDRERLGVRIQAADSGIGEGLRNRDGERPGAASEVEHMARAVHDDLRQECPFERCFTRGDRKSTRLNSSHSQISYAVFCLKKK